MRKNDASICQSAKQCAAQPSIDGARAKVRLDGILSARHPDFSRARLEGLIKAGFVTVNGVCATKAGQKVSPCDDIVLTIPPPVPAVPNPEDIPLTILHEDDDIIVIDKPAGLVVHPAPGHFSGTLVNALLHHCPSLAGIGGVARPGIVHRLDQDTSGVMIVAKTQRAMDVLAKEFSSHANMEKTYLAIVHGVPVPAEGRIENLIGRSPFDRKKMAIVERNGKTAITRYKLLATNPGFGLAAVRCDIETGRTHQIRVHMASLGTPVAGDAVYGRARLDKQLSPPPARQLLHAWRLSLKHPITRIQMTFEAPIPKDFNPYFPSSTTALK